MIRERSRSVFCSAPKRLVALAAALPAAALFLIPALGQVTPMGSQFSVGGPGLISPAGVAADGQGNVYIVDQGNNRVLGLASTSNGFGSPATVLSGLSGPSQAVADWSGDLFVADTGNNRIVMLPMTSAGLGAPVTVAVGFNNPTGVAVDSAGNIYVADCGNHRIAEVPLSGNGYASPITVALGFHNPVGVAIDQGFNLYVADTGATRVVKELHSAQGYLSSQTVGYGLNAPTAVSVDQSGNVYIADTGNSRIVEAPWNPPANRYNSIITVGTGFVSPQAVTPDWTGKVYVADPVAGQAMVVMTRNAGFGSLPTGSLSTQITSNFEISAGTTLGSVGIYTQGVTGADFNDAGASSCLPQTYAVVTYCGVNVTFAPRASGSRLGAVVLYDNLGNPLATSFLTGTGIEPQARFLPASAIALGQQLSGPAGVTVDGSGNVYISDTNNNRVVEIPWTGTAYGGQVTIPVNGLINPSGLTVDGAGNLFIVCNGNDKVVELPWTGSGYGPQTKVGTGFYGPTNIAADNKGNLYVTDTLDNGVDLLPWTGTSYGRSQQLGNYSKFPSGIVVDAAGDVYFTNPYLNAVAEIPWNGTKYIPQKQLQLSGISFPAALAMDGNSNLYVLDAGNNRVVMLPWNGTSFGSQITVAGGLNAPADIAVDAAGSLYVADTGNNQVVKIAMSTPRGLSFASTYLGSTSADSPQAAVMENLGNAALTIDAVNYPPDFPEMDAAGNICSDTVSIAPGQSCLLPVAFTPLAVGSPLSEQIEISDNNLGETGSQQTITVSGISLANVSQSITFPPIVGVVYGSAPIALYATASSGLPITYQVVSGPAILSGRGSMLTLTGAGTVLVVASQGGNAEYLAANPVTLSFAVAPAILTVSPANVTATYGAIPTSFKYSISGFVLGQNASETVTGAPMIAPAQTGSIGVGTYSLTSSQGTLSAQNYEFVFATGTLMVVPAVLKVSAVSFSCVYGSGAQTLPWTLSGFVNGDGAGVVTGAPLMTSVGSAATSVGSYPIVVSQGSLAAANYSFSLSQGVLTVAPAHLTVTASNQTITYGESIPQLGYSISGFVNGDTASIAIQGAPLLAARASPVPQAGTYQTVASIGTLKAENYSFSFVCGTLIVARAQLTVVPNDATMIYGGKVPPLTYSISGFVNGDLASSSVWGSPSLSTSATSQSPAGEVAIVASARNLGAQNYFFVFGAGTMTIGKATLTVVPRPASSTYGAQAAQFAYDFEGFVNGDVAAVVQGMPMFVPSATAQSPVGTYPVSGTVGTLQAANYKFVVQTGTLQVAKAVLTVTPADATMTYGGPIPGFSYTLKGFVNGDSGAVVSGSPMFSTAATQRSPVGSYLLNATSGSLSAQNYLFVCQTGTLSVTPAVLIVTPSDLSMVYGSKVPVLTYNIRGFVNGDTPSRAVSGSPSLSTSANSLSSVGTFPILGAPGTLAAQNYIFSFGSGTLTVGKALLTVTPRSASSTYGSPAPAITFDIEGFANGDGLSVIQGAPVFATNAGLGSPVGTYPVTGTAGTLSAANYNFLIKNGTLQINKAVLTVTPVSATMTYGGAFPAFQYTLGGFANGDTASVVSGSPRFAAQLSRRDPVGSYPVVVTQGNLWAQNYSFVCQNGVITETQATLTVTASPASMTYGGSVPALSYTLRGFLSGDTEAVVSGTAIVQSAANSSSPVGTYPTQVSIGSLTATNYRFVAVDGIITVNQARLKVIPASASMTYGGQLPEFGYSLEGFVNGDGASVVSGSPAFATEATAASPVGSYSVSVTQGSLSSSNYSFMCENGKLTVGKAILKITPVSTFMIYGGSVPAFAYTAVGFVNGDGAAVLSGAPAFETSASSLSHAGIYPLNMSAGSLAAANYSLVFEAGTLFIEKAVLSVAPVPATMIYGSVAPNYEFQATGFVNGDGPQVISGTARFSPVAPSNPGVGTYVLNVIVSGLSAKDYTFIAVPGVLSVTPAVLTVQPTAQTMSYGGTVPALAYTISGFAQGDSQSSSTSGSPSLTTSATSISSAGSYSTQASAGTLSAANYTFLFGAGTMTVAPAPLTVTAANASMTVGSALPSFTYTMAGWVNGDTAATALTGAPALSTSATSASVAGKYPIQIAAGTLAAQNYTFVFVNGTLTVTK